MYTWKITDVEVDPEDGIWCRVRARLANSDVPGSRTAIVTFDFTQNRNWRQSTATFENADGKEVTSIPTAAIGVLETANKMAEQRARKALKEQSEAEA